MTTDIIDPTVSSNSDADIFGRRGFLVIPQLLEPALAAFFWSYAHTKFASLLLASDHQVPKTPSSYGDPAFDGLLEYVRPRKIIADCGCYRPIPTFASTNTAMCSRAIATGKLVK